MSNIAILGHATRGNEVIELLEMLGGENVDNYTGNDTSWYYIIRDNNIDWCHECCPNADCISFTLEEFLEKFPHKVGDKVSSKYLKNYKIAKIEWEGTNNRVIYKLQGMGWYSVDELQPYKEETMERINIAEILRDCPKGMELDCTMWNDVTFEMIQSGAYPIKIRINGDVVEHLTDFGEWNYNNNSKCVIFPKGKTTWEGFQRPFKDGDVIALDNSNKDSQIFIFKEYIREDYAQCYMMLDDDGSIDFECGDYYVERLATKEEEQRLFQAIKDNGYKWNAETKTLEKLEVEKFDINTLKAFDKVLVRDTKEQVWVADLFSHAVNRPLGGYTFACIGHYPNQCIPYENNEHLLGTRDDCDEYYKTWEK